MKSAEWSEAEWSWWLFSQSRVYDIISGGSSFQPPTSVSGSLRFEMCEELLCSHPIDLIERIRLNAPSLRWPGVRWGVHQSCGKPVLRSIVYQVNRNSTPLSRRRAFTHRGHFPTCIHVLGFLGTSTETGAEVPMEHELIHFMAAFHAFHVVSKLYTNSESEKTVRVPRTSKKYWKNEVCRVQRSFWLIWFTPRRYLGGFLTSFPSHRPDRGVPFCSSETIFVLISDRRGVNVLKSWGSHVEMGEHLTCVNGTARRCFQINWDKLDHI